ncbi:hypothetical protein IFR04_014519 [Cadophora malorum]|uniref:Uncharacterized protein n=1 Tax=Cadophora malorum TaxID=108018 RepID=A0A8H7T4J1_9HELO|nr:hypothetical protein IFR04_014519 [Cadophora malorum]
MAYVISVKLALAALAVINKARIENPYFNIYEFSNQNSASDGSSITPPLDLGLASLQNSTLKKAKDTASNSSTENTLRKSYSISPELATAARILAESTTQVPTGDQPEIAASIKKKYASKVNNTNQLAQRLAAADGLLGYKLETDLALSANKTAPSSSSLAKRDLVTIF